MEFYQKIFGAIFVVLISLYIKFCLNRRKLYKLVDKMPGTRKIPIPGLEGLITAIQFAGKDNKEIFEWFLNCYKNVDGTTKLWLLNKCYVVIEDPKDLQIIFNSPNSMEKSDIQKILPVPKGLVCGAVETWRPHRKYLNPAFKSSVLRSFNPITNQKALKLMEIYEKRVGKGEFDVLGSMNSSTLEALLESMLGVKDEYINNENHPYLKTCEKVHKYMGQKLIKLWLHYKPILMMTKHYQFEQEYIFAKDGVLGMADKILAENEYRRKGIDDITEAGDDGDSDEDVTKKPRILIDYFIANKLNWPLDELRDELNTVFLAGFDTSAYTLAGSVLMLAMHQDVQDKVVEELHQVFQSVDEEVTEEHLKQLVYLEYVINETLRLFPVLPMLSRHTTGEVELEDHTIPGDVEIFMPQFITFRNKKYWGEDADLFKPERFYPERFSNIHPYAFTPFAQGPRICIGMRYGMAVMKIILAHIFRRFKAKTQLKFEEIEYEFHITVKVKQDYMVELERREF